jgi:hypothetical protein
MGGVEEIVRADLVDGLLKIGDVVDVSVGVFPSGLEQHASSYRQLALWAAFFRRFAAGGGPNFGFWRRPYLQNETGVDVRLRRLLLRRRTADSSLTLRASSE